MKEKETEILAIWFIIGMFVLLFPIGVIANHFDFAIYGANMFSVENNPFFNPDEIDEEHREEAIKAMQKLENTWGNPNAFLDTKFNFKLPNITNVGVIFAMILYCCSIILWDFIGKRYVVKFILKDNKTINL